jgi:hypothetical protein
MQSAIRKRFFLEMYAAFYLGFVLILVFEILDLTTDDPHLQTVTTAHRS